MMDEKIARLRFCLQISDKRRRLVCLRRVVGWRKLEIGITFQTSQEAD